MRDFSDETVGYLRNAEIASCLKNLNLTGKSQTEALLSCYEALHGIGIVPSEELALVELWLQALKQVRS
jgi:hypothetical protein